MLKPILAALALTTLALPAQAQVLIKKGMTEFTVTLNEETCTIGRDQDTGAVIHPSYAPTAQGRPQAISLGSGIETLGELEFIKYMQAAETDENITVIDTRTEGWHANLRIPCTLNVPFTLLNDDKDIAIFTTLDYFGVEENDDGSLNFDNAKTVVGYCNGYWCAQTPAMFVRAKYSLINLGYPGEKLKYYRGGMQAWTSLGLSVEGLKK